MSIEMAAGVWRVAPVVAILASAPAGAEGVDWSGYASLEPRIFMHGAAFAGQSDAAVSPSAVLAPELRFEWHEGDDRLTLAPWFRWDAGDDERTHADLREANWLHVRGSWSWRIGLGRVFWGVTESRHLVDIINQTDQVEDLDEEDKLGQPMVALERWTANAGTLGVFLLPGFRERTFPDVGARLRGTLPVDTDRTEYESGAGDRRIDWALRWSHAIGRWDLGISGFHGTSREPRLLAGADGAGRPVLIPRYDVISQLSADIQYTRGAWLWKLETIGRRGHGEAFAGYVAGFEYTWFDVWETGADLGLLAERLYDGRDETAPPTIYENDWFVGFRVGLNDAQDTTILGGAVADSNGSLAVIEAERRVGDAWKIEAEVRWFVGVDANDPLLGGFRNDSFVTLRLSRYL